MSGKKALAAHVGAWCAVGAYGPAATVAQTRVVHIEGEAYTPDELAAALVLATRWESPDTTEGLSDDAVADIVLLRAVQAPQEADG